MRKIGLKSEIFSSGRLRTKVVDMNPNRKIKVIKNAQREEKSSEEVRTEPKPGLADKNRAVAGRVGAWVREFQQRQIVDPRRAFASLFVAPGT